MSKTETMVLELHSGAPGDFPIRKAILTVNAPKLVLCSQYADLRDDDGKLLATVTWTSPVTARKVSR